nr:hypothetical protein [Tanacetum cinerariifolium]
MARRLGNCAQLEVTLSRYTATRLTERRKRRTSHITLFFLEVTVVAMSYDFKRDSSQNDKDSSGDSSFMLLQFSLIKSGLTTLYGDDPCVHHTSIYKSRIFKRTNDYLAGFMYINNYGQTPNSITTITVANNSDHLSDSITITGRSCTLKVILPAFYKVVMAG